MKVWFCGSRGFKDHKTIRDLIYIHYKQSSEIRTGGAKGIDKITEKAVIDLQASNEKNYDGIVPKLLESLKPDWKVGKHAGLLRNKEGVDWADLIIAIWDGKSPGTAHCVKYAMEQNVKVELYTLDTSGEFDDWNFLVFRHSEPKIVTKKEKRKQKVASKKSTLKSWAAAANKEQKRRNKHKEKMRRERRKKHQSK